MCTRSRKSGYDWANGDVSKQDSISVTVPLAMSANTLSVELFGKAKGSDLNATQDTISVTSPIRIAINNIGLDMGI